MTFLEIVNMVLAGSFDESKRSHAKAWVNSQLGQALDSESWSFMRATDTVSVTSGSRTVSGVAPAFALGIALLDSDGEPLVPIADFDAFLERYPSDADTGTPEAWTQLGTTIMVGPSSDTTAADWTLFYEMKHTDLTADGDTPVLPSQYHVPLALGAKAYGMRMLGIPLWAEHEQAWQQALETMRRKYLATMRAPGSRLWS